MWPYWFLFLTLASCAAVEMEHRPSHGTGVRSTRFTGVLMLIWLLLVIMIGFRWQVGGDWGNYSETFRVIQGLSLEEALDQTRYEAGYTLLNFLSSWAGWEIYGVNVICAAIFSLGLITFCSTLPYPRLAIAVATPYLVIVVAMGYTRQSVALGFEMLALVALSRKSVVSFVIWLLLGATFHKSAVALIPLVALVNARNWFWSALWGGIASATAYLTLFSDLGQERLINTYVDTVAISSSGGLIRAFMNAVPALLLLVWRRRFTYTGDERLWFWMAIISLILMIGAAMAPSSSTAIDRMALYFLPIQLFVFSNLPKVLGQIYGEKVIIVSVVAYYCLVQLVWLNFADNAWAWVPYGSMFFAGEATE